MKKYIITLGVIALTSAIQCMEREAEKRITSVVNDSNADATINISYPSLESPLKTYGPSQTPQPTSFKVPKFTTSTAVIPLPKSFENYPNVDVLLENTKKPYRINQEQLGYNTTIMIDEDKNIIAEPKIKMH